MFSSWFSGDTTTAEENAESKKEEDTIVDLLSGWMGSTAEVINGGLAAVNDMIETAEKTASTHTPGTFNMDVAILTELPEQWQDNRRAWSLAVEASLSHEGFCRLSLTDVLNETTQHEDMKEVLSSLCGDNWTQEVKSIEASQFIPSESFVEWLTGNPAIHNVFSQLVPEHISEETYFKNIGSKWTLLRHSERTVQLVELVKAMSGPDATRPACWEELDKEVECIEADRVFVEEQEKEVTENIEHAAGNIKLLETLLAKNEVSSPLAESVRDSCVYHGEKLARLGAAIEESSGRFQGTALDIKDGPTYRSLQETIATLKRLEEVFETERAAAVDGGDKSPSPATADRAELSVERAASAEGEDLSFEAVLPWETEKEE